MLRLVCSNGLISTTQESASYRHISERILVEFREYCEEPSNNIGNQRRGWEISINTPCKSAEETFKSFNRQFNLRDNEIKAVEWAWPQQSGDSMFNIVNTYTKAAQYPKLPAESAFQTAKDRWGYIVTAQLIKSLWKSVNGFKQANKNMER